MLPQLPPLRPPLQPQPAALFFLLFCTAYAHQLAAFALGAAR